ncbi:MAG: hypothetical protein M1827_001668 [Pycnora praestabilis]|nr:MAG: hypothetical protein M1827_001668 [Pycnora praestabilis]
MAESEPSYIDYEAFLDPSFSPTSFANTLLLATNNPSDTPLDLSTPLSRVLFDVQEIDTHIHTLTTKSALALLNHTKDDTDASQRIVKGIETQVSSLTEGYQRLEKEVIRRWEEAEEVRIATERLWHTVRIGRSVGRCLLLGRQLEVQMAELGGTGSGSGKREDHRAMVRASNTLLTLRQLFAADGAGEEGEGLDRVNAIVTLKTDLVVPAERKIQAKAQQVVREFSMSSLSASSASTAQPSNTLSASTYAQSEDTKSRATSAILTLYLLSPTSKETTLTDFQPSLMVSALQTYLQTALTSSLASLSRALGTLPTLDRTLIEVSARCQNVVALEALLESIKPPQHPLLLVDESSAKQTVASIDTANGASNGPTNLLQPLLHSLDTSSLPSYFWRSLASSLSSRVQDIMNRGGVSARTLRTNRDRVRDAIKEAVLRGSQLPTSSLSRGKTSSEQNWEREAAVMVGAVIGVLGR